MGSKYDTSESFALVHRPASSNTQGVACNANEQARQTHKREPDFSYPSLRNRLGLGSWKCGRRTTAKTPCPNGILHEKRDQIESLIKSMVCLSQESLELKPKVDRLAQLAHCQSHRREDLHDIRKANWIAAFPVRKSDQQHLEEQIIELFGPASTKCSAAMIDSSLCEKNVGGRKVQNFQRIINDIMRLSLYQNDSQIDCCLSILERNIYCSDHEPTRPLQRMKIWKSRILEIRTKADLTSFHRELPNGIGCKVSPLDTKNQQVSNSIVPRSLDINGNPALSWLDEFDTTPFHIISRKSRRQKTTLKNYIQNKIDQTLSNSHKIPGYVYVIESENIQEYFKIGYTTSPVIQRLEKLTFGCNRQFKVLFPTPSESPKMVPNAWRVEELCHAELVDCQVYVDCTGCLCEHHEWFRISAAQAIATVQRWSAWMNSTPYDLAGGILKGKERYRISNMHKFRNEIAGAAIEDIS